MGVMYGGSYLVGMMLYVLCNTWYSALWSACVLFGFMCILVHDMEAVFIWMRCFMGCLWITKCSAESGSLGGIYAVEGSCGNLWSVCFTVCIRAGCSHRVIRGRLKLCLSLSLG